MKIEQINKLTISAYEKTASKYYEYFRNEVFQKEYDRSILDKFSGLMKDNSMICDAGCGPAGQIGAYMAQKGHDIVGIDISQRCIDIASLNNPGITFKTMDMMNTDFEDSFFDGIISFYSIVYTPKEYISRIFTELNRILKPGGRLVIVVKRGTEEGIIDNDWYEGKSVYFTHFIESEITSYFESNSFRLDFLDTRKPYEFEIQVERIYAIGTKINKNYKQI
jgi:SAM-dependent methyltransferase